MAFLYFIPFESIANRQLATAADFRQLGIDYALDGRADPDSAAPVKGPEGRDGLIAACPGTGRAPRRYDPASQLWAPGPERSFYVGMSREKRPGPAELARGRIYDGQSVELADGNLWVVPRCWGILHERGPTIPFKLGLAEDGRTIIGRPHPRFASLCEAAREYGTLLFGSESERQELSAKWTFQRQVALAIAALQVNYRIGLVEAISLLELLGSDEVVAICDAVVDARAIIEEAERQADMEKKAADAASSGPAMSCGSPA